MTFFYFACDYIACDLVWSNNDHLHSEIKVGFGASAPIKNAFVHQVFNGYAVENGSPNALLALSEWEANGYSPNTYF